MFRIIVKAASAMIMQSFGVMLVHVCSARIINFTIKIKIKFEESLEKYIFNHVYSSSKAIHGCLMRGEMAKIAMTRTNGSTNTMMTLSMVNPMECLTHQIQLTLQAPTQRDHEFYN